MPDKNRKPDGPMEDWPDHEREDYVETLPKRVQAYIAFLEGEIEQLDEDLQAGKDAVTFDEALAQTWDAVACLRVVAKDEPGAWRAWRAAKIARSA